MTTDLRTERGDVTGDAVSLSAFGLDSFEIVERTIELRCASGHRSTARWRGVSLLDVVERLSVPAETTHLIVTSDDGYRTCIEIRTTFEGMLALARDGILLADDERPRLVAPDLDGIRTVKGVTTLMPVSLPPDENPEQLEELRIGK